MDLSGVKLAAKKYGIFAGFPDSNSALFRLVSYFPRTSWIHPVMGRAVVQMNSGAFAAPKRGKGIPDPSSAGTYAEHALRSRYQMIGVFCRTNAGSFWMTNSSLLPKKFLGHNKGYDV